MRGLLASERSLSPIFAPQSPAFRRDRHCSAGSRSQPAFNAPFPPGFREVCPTSAPMEMSSLINRPLSDRDHVSEKGDSRQPIGSRAASGIYLGQNDMRRHGHGQVSECAERGRKSVVSTAPRVSRSILGRLFMTVLSVARPWPGACFSTGKHPAVHQANFGRRTAPCAMTVRRDRCQSIGFCRNACVSGHRRGRRTGRSWCRFHAPASSVADQQTPQDTSRGCRNLTQIPDRNPYRISAQSLSQRMPLPDRSGGIHSRQCGARIR